MLLFFTTHRDSTSSISEGKLVDFQAYLRLRKLVRSTPEANDIKVVFGRDKIPERNIGAGR